MPPTLASSSTPRQRLSDSHRSRLEVFVDIPPSPFHTARMTPKATPQTSSKPTPATHKQSTSNITPKSMKRKLDVFVDIPPSPLHRTTKTPSNSARPIVASSLLRRRSQVYVEIPASPLSIARMKGTLNTGLRPSPLSTKAFNLNTAVDPPSKKQKLSNTAASIKQRGGNETFPNGHFNCHQCRKKIDNSRGLQCTVFLKKRCKAKYCKPCLRNRYGLDAEEVRREATVASERHESTESYQWTCPRCADYCNCFKCRKAKGLPSTGKITVPPAMMKATKSGVHAHAKMFDVYKLGGSSANLVTRVKEVKMGQREQQPKPRAPRAKKPVQEPKWSSVPTELNRSQIEDRFFLREFLLRFSSLMPRIGVTHLEELDLFHNLSRQCAKALVHGLLDLIAADAGPEESKLIVETVKKISSSGMEPAMLWARLNDLRKRLPEEFFIVPIPDPCLRPSFVEDESDDETESLPQRASSRIKTRRGVKNMAPEQEEVLDLNNGVTHAMQLLPCIIALCECVLRGPSIRAEIEEGTADTRGENRSYFADVRKENERWTKERTAFGWSEGDDEVNEKGIEKNGKVKAKDTEKDKAYRTARETHKARLTGLENTHMLELQGAAPRFGPLGRDSQGRVYYAASVHRRKDKRTKPKIPDEEDRRGLRKWSWFLAVWGPGGVAHSASDEKEEGWWGFADPAEVRQLAKWLAAIEGVDGKDSVVEGPGGIRMQTGPDSELLKTGSNAEGQGPPSQVQVKALVKGLNDYADLLAWRIDGEKQA